MKHSEFYRVGFHDTDSSGNLSAAAALKYMQETAYLQLHKLGPTPAELTSSGRGFILSRIALSYYRPIRAYEQIEVQTWTCESKGYSFLRCYRIIRGGIICAEGSSVWALMDFEKRRPVKVTDFSYNFEDDEPLELDVPKSIKMPESLRLVGEHTVSYSDTDSNRHMTNTRYPELICNFIPNMKDRRVSNLAINFLGEAPMDSTLKVYYAKYDDSAYIRTLREDGTKNIEAEVILE